MSATWDIDTLKDLVVLIRYQVCVFGASTNIIDKWNFYSKLYTYETNLIFLSSTQLVLGVMLIMCHPDSNSSLVVVQLRAVSFITIVAPHFPFAICSSEIGKLDCMDGQSQASSFELMDLTKLTFNSTYLITGLSTKADSKR